MAGRRSKKPKSNTAATLADVGRAAGVSAMAASAALNRARTSSRISAETRERIIQAANALNYRPNIAARALATRRMHTIGVAAVVDGELNDYFLEVFKGVVAAGAAHHQNTTVFSLTKWATDASRIGGLCDGRIDGLILLAPTVAIPVAAMPHHTPFVSIHANVRLPGVTNIESNEEEGAYQMVRALLARGHRRIMLTTGPDELTGAGRRLRGYKRALASARIPLDQELIVPATFNAEGTREALRRWMRQHPGHLLPQAVFCSNDSAAVGCLEVLAEMGLRVPEDISVAGFDDTLVARIVVPQLSSVRQPLQLMGMRAVELLLQRIEHTGDDAKDGGNVVFPVDLVDRGSVSVPPVVDRLIPALH